MSEQPTEQASEQAASKQAGPFSAEQAEQDLTTIREIVGALDDESTLDAVRDMAGEWEHYSKEMAKAGYETIPRLTKRAEQAEQDLAGALALGDAYRLMLMTITGIADTYTPRDAPVSRTAIDQAVALLHPEQSDDRARELGAAVSGLVSTPPYEGQSRDGANVCGFCGEETFLRSEPEIEHYKDCPWPVFLKSYRAATGKGRE